MKKIKLFFINGIILTITSLIMRMAGLIFNIYITNKVGSEAIGVFGLIMSIYMLAITVATSGINLATTRIVSEEITKCRESGAKKAVITCILYSLTFGIITSIILILNSNYICINWLHGKVSSKPLYFIGIALPFISMSCAINGYFTAIGKSFKTASSQIFEFIIKIIATIYILKKLFPQNIESTCLALIVGDCISEICSFTYLILLFLFDKIIKKYYKKTSFKYSKRIFRVTIPVALTSYIRSGLSTLKQLIIPSGLEKHGISCDEAMSQYGLINGMVMQIITFPSVFINSFSNLLIPEYCYFNEKKTYTKMNITTFKIFKLSLLYSIYIGALFFNFSNEISITIYKNHEAALFIKVMSLLIPFIYIDGIIDNILKGLDKQVTVMLCNILDLFISIGSIYLLLPIYGIYGYIIVIYISEIFNFSISFWQLKKISKSNFYITNLILYYCISAIFASIIIVFIKFKLNNNIISLILNIILFTVIYFFTSKHFKIKNE